MRGGGANRDQSSGSGHGAPMKNAVGDGGTTSTAPRSLSGSKFNSSYAQQLKKQVQASSQANNIDPLSTKQYLQNYLSEHPAATSSNTTGTANSHSKASVPLKVIKQVQQAFSSSNNSGQSAAAAAQGSGSHSQFKQNYASQSKQDSGQPQKMSSNSSANLGRNNNNYAGRSGGLNTQSHSQLQGASNTGAAISGGGLGSGVGEALSLDRRKDRASSSSKQQQKLTDGVSRSLVRPNSKNRLSSQQPTGSVLQATQKIFPSATSGKQQSSSQQARGASPKIPLGSGGGSSHQQLNMSGQNLQNYFVDNNNNSNQTGTAQGSGQMAGGTSNNSNNNIPYHGATGAHSSKNLPRKKRITVQQQQTALIGNSQTSVGTNNNNNSSSAAQYSQSKVQSNGGEDSNPGASTSSILSNNRVAAGSRNKNSAAAAGLPPMNAANTTGSQQAAQHTMTGQRAPSPGMVNKKPPGSRSQSHNNDRNNINNRPTAANHDPQPFQKEELFLNVDSQYNDLIMQMIQPNRSHFDFEGSVQYVMNASELSNQALAKLLFQRKNIALPKMPEGGPKNNGSTNFNNNALSSTSNATVSSQFKTPMGGNNQRSRNLNGDSGLGRNGAAGQSTASFFNTKKSFLAATYQQASSGLVENGIKRAEGYHDGPDSQAMIGKDFYQSVRQEVRTGTIDHIKQLMPDYQSAKYSAKRNGIVAAYGANTNQGIVRNYNEDRVAIILNIMKPKSKQFSGAEWPKCSFFGIYDGHGGHVCADFLRDYLHQFIIKDQYFPKEPIKAIKNGFMEAEKLFLEFAEGQQFEVGDIDRSGSCAIVALIIDDMCYIGNTGDSRACMSADGGKQVVGLSNDHKPTDDIEMYRILNNHGRIYQNASIVNVQQPGLGGLSSQIVLGPHRVFPGRLSVCRTFGDIEAKLEKLDGNNRVVVADPDVTAFRIDRGKHDFIVIGCDGIFDKLENRDCVHLVWQACLMEETGTEPLVNPVDEETQGNAKQAKTQDERRHKLAGLAVDSILKTCAMRRSCDNITSVVIAFDNFYRKIDESKIGSQRKTEGTTLTSNDHEVFEEVQLTPVGDNYQDTTSNVIYIESDDHLESITESTNMDQADDQAKDVLSSAAAKAHNQISANATVKNQSDGSSSLLYGETGTTNPSGNSNSSITAIQNAINPNSQQQMAAMTMMQNPSSMAPMQNGVDVTSANPYHMFGTQDKILSEIAEEDSISMISDKPRRFKPSDCVTPADPVTNSFMGSMRESQSNITNTRLKETANRMMHENAAAAAAAASNLQNAAAGGAGSSISDKQQQQSQQQLQQQVVLPYTSSTAHPPAHQTQIYGNASLPAGKSPLIGGGSSQVSQKRPPSASKQSHLADEQQQHSNNNTRFQRPHSGQRSGSGQNSRLSNKNSTGQATSGSGTSQAKVSIGASSGLQQLIENSQNNHLSSSNTGSQQTRARQGGRSALGGASSKMLANHQSNQYDAAGEHASAYGASGVVGNPQQQQNPQQQHSQSQQSLMPALLGTSNSQPDASIPNNGRSSGVGGPAGTHSNSAGALSQVKKQTRRSSNQSHQRGTYGQSGSNVQQRSSQAQHHQQVNHGSQSQGSMPPPSSSTQLLPMSTKQNTNGTQHGNQGISLVNQKRQNQNSKSANTDQGTGKKAKTQQPNKLVELFRQVDGNQERVGSQGQVVNTTQQSSTSNGPSGLHSNQFVPKGSLSSNNQMLMRTMQMNNPLATHGAQVHNIQIKPISATKRRGGTGPQNLMQAQFHNQNGPGQSNSGTPGTVGNILNRSQKEKAQFSQTSVLNSGKDVSINQAKQPQNKLISQYLAQVNKNSSHLDTNINTSSTSINNNQTSSSSGGQNQYSGGAYASRSTRNTGAGAASSSTDKPSPGVFNRAQRVQMTYNQSLPLSKTHHSHHMGGSSSGSRLQSSHSNHHPAGNSVAGAGAGVGNSNNSAIAQGILTNSAYAQQLIKKEGKSRNGSNSHTAVSGSASMPPNVGSGGGGSHHQGNHHQQQTAASSGQATSNGGHSQHHLPKWQSLNNANSKQSNINN